MSQQTQTQTQSEIISEVSAVVIRIKQDGKFERGLTPAEWRKATMRKKYDHASNFGMESHGVSIYRNIEFTVDSNLRMFIESARDCVEVPCGIDDVRDVIWKYCGRNPVFIILTSAVALKSTSGPMYNMRLVNQIHVDRDVEARWIDEQIDPQPVAKYNVAQLDEIDEFLKKNPYILPNLREKVEKQGLHKCNCGAWRVPVGDPRIPHEHRCRFNRDDHLLSDVEQDGLRRTWSQRLMLKEYEKIVLQCVNDPNLDQVDCIDSESDEEERELQREWERRELEMLEPMRAFKQAGSADAKMQVRAMVRMIVELVEERGGENRVFKRQQIDDRIRWYMRRCIAHGLVESEILEVLRGEDCEELMPLFVEDIIDPKPLRAEKQSDREREIITPEDFVQECTQEECLRIFTLLKKKMDEKEPLPYAETRRGKQSWGEWLGFGNPAKDLTDIAKSARTVAGESESTGKRVRDFVTKIEEPVERILSTLGEWTSCSKAPEVISFILDIMCGAYSDGYSDEENLALTMQNADLWKDGRVKDAVKNRIAFMSKRSKGTQYPVLRVVFRALTILGIMPSMIRALITKFSGAIAWIVAQFSKKTLEGTGAMPAIKQSDNDSFLGLSVAAVGTALLGMLPDDKKLKAVGERVRLFNQGTVAMRKIEDLWGYILGLIPVCVREWLCIISPSERVAKMLVSDGEAKKWIEEVDYLEMMKTEIVRNYDLQERALKARASGQAFMADLALKYKDAKDTSKIFAVVMRYQTMAKALGDAVDQVRRDKGVRPTPFCLYVTGPPGVGKSTIARSLVQTVIPRDFNMDNAIYARNSAAKFWDSYHNQFCTLNDDFYQNRDATDVAEVISMVSNNTYFPEFASMTDPKMGVKGTAFNSPLVMLLSNTPYPEVTNKDIRCDEAFMRRRNILVKIVPEPDACEPGTERVIHEKRDSENWTHVRFHILDPLNKRMENQPLEILTYEQFVYKFMTDFRKWTNRELSSLKHQQKGEKVQSIRERWERENPDLLIDPLQAVKQAWFKNPFSGEVEIVKDVEGRKTEFQLSDEVQAEIRVLNLEAEREKNEYPLWKTLAWIGGICGGIGLTIYTLYRLYNRFWGKDEETLPKQKTTVKQSMSERTMRRSGAEARRKMIAQAGRDTAGQITDLKRAIEAFPELKDLPRLVSTLERYGRCLKESNDKVALDAFDEEAIRVLAEEEQRAKEACEAISPDWMEVSFGVMRLSGESWDREMGNLISSLVASVEKPSDDVRTASKTAMDCIQRRDRSGATMAAAKLFGYIARDEGDSLKMLNDAARLGMLTARMSSLQAVKQGCTDQQATDLAEGVFMKHMCSLKNTVTDDTLCGLMIAGSIVMAPRHIFSMHGGMIKEGSIIEWKPVEGGSGVKIAFQPKRLAPLYDSQGCIKDVVLYDLGKAVRAYSDIRGHFPKREDLYKYTHLNGIMLVKGFSKDVPVMKSLSEIRPVTSVSLGGVAYDDYDSEVRSMDSWIYRGNTNHGDCGAPIVAFNSKLPQKLIGIHTYAVAGDELSGGEIVSREQIGEAMRVIGEPIIGTPVLPDLDGLEKGWPYLEKTLNEDTNILIHGVLQSNRVVRGATKTRIRKTPYFERVVPNDKEPAPLTSDDPRVLEEYRETPLIKGIENFGMQKGEPYDPVLLENAIQDTIHEVLAFTARDPRFVATEKEAINGMQFSSCDSLNMKSSAGYPYVLSRKSGETGKSGVIAGEIGDKRVVDPELRRRIDERIAKHSKRQLVESTWMASLKDELRPVTKVVMNKTRTFIMGPLDNTIVSRQYLLALNSAMFRNHGKPGFFYAPGIDPQSIEWDRLIRDMLEMSDVGFSGDYGRYDSTLRAELMDSVRRVADAFYENDPSGMYVDTEEAKNVRACLFHEYAQTCVLVGNQLTQKFRGNPSGCNCTTLNNGICNTVHAKYVWQKVMPEQYKDLVFFHSNVRIKNFGDDIILSVKRPMLQWYNAVSYAQVSAEVGMEFTNADKASEVKPVEKVLEMTFLKQGFRLKNGRYVATLDRSSINAMFNWISDTPEFWRATEENACAALRYAWSYDRKYFDDLRSTAIMEAAKLGYSMKLPSYDYFERAYARTGALPSLAYDPFEVYEYSEVRHLEPLRAVAQSSKMGSGEHDEPSGGKPAEMMSEQGSMGILQLEQTEVIRVEKPKASDDSRIAEASANDFKWTMQNTVEKPHLVLTGTWAETDPQLAIKEELMVPRDFISEDSVAHTPFGLHAFWRGKLEIHVSITGTKFNTGRLIMYHVPLVDKNWAQGRIKTMAQMTALPHIFLDPADNSGGKLTIPFTHPNGFLNIRDPAPIDFLGTFYLRVANVLRIGDGQPATVGYSITVRFIDSDFQIQIPTEIIPGRISERKLAQRERKARKEMEALARIREVRSEVHYIPLRGVKQGNYMVKTYNLSHSVMKTEGNETQTSENKLDVKASELDYPNINLQGPTFRRIGMGNFSNCDNIDFNERLALHPGDAKMPIEKETFATSHDEMELSWLYQMPSWYRTLSWSSSQAAGTVLAGGWMCPLDQALDGGLTLGSSTGMLTTRDWASAKFTYWQGDLKLRLQLIASMYHTGKLFVSLMYGVYNLPSTLTLEQVTSTKGFYVDINSVKHDFEFTMDWFSPKPFLKVPNGIRTGTEILERAMGSWSIWVVEPLRMGPGVADTVDINLWTYSGSNYECSLLAENNATIIASDQAAISPLRAVKQAEGGESTMKNGGHPVNINHEKVASIKDIFKRRNLISPKMGGSYAWAFNISELFFRNRNQTTWTGGLSNTPYQAGRGLTVWFGSGYRGYHGSTRFRARYSAATVVQGLVRDAGFGMGYINGSSTPTWSASTGAFKLSQGLRRELYYDAGPADDETMMFLQSQPAFTWSDPGCNVLDVEVPFYAAEKFKILSLGASNDVIQPDDDEANVGSILIMTPGPFYDITGAGVQTPTTTNLGSVDMWIAGGDDLRVGVFLGPPNIALLPSNLGNDSYPM